MGKPEQIEQGPGTPCKQRENGTIYAPMSSIFSAIGPRAVAPGARRGLAAFRKTKV